MANQMSGRVLIMDTATANWAANGLPGQQLLRCYKAFWLNPTATGDTVTIKEADGSVQLTLRAESGGGSQVITFTQVPLNLSYQRGWFLSQISSGTLYLYT